MVCGSVSKIMLGDNLPMLKALPDGIVDLVYIDPPFNTGRARKHTRVSTKQDAEGQRQGFGGRRYSTTAISTHEYGDQFEDFQSFIRPRLVELHRVLKSTGSLFFHIDWREVHYCKVMLDGIFGRECFMNEIIWAYDYGGRSKQRWSSKHDNILWYVADPKNYTFNFDAMDRIPYMAPGLVGKDKAERGKTPTDVWWHTIVPTRGTERTGYPTQKPLGIVERIVNVHSNPGDLLLDCFCGSGTLGVAAANNQRRYLLMDQNIEAVEIAAQRLAFDEPECHGFGQ